MSFNPQRGSYYRMPIFFGPLPGPRQWPAGKDFDFDKTPKRVVVGSRFRTNKEQLESFLPDCYKVWGDPIVTVEVTYMTELGWLAGRGYNMCDVKFPAVYTGPEGPIHGTLVLVRWEDLADPILSGREELGHNKLYCEIPPLAGLEGSYSTRMSWLHFPFLKVAVWDLKDAPVPASDPLNKGLLSYKYMPATGEWGTSDVEYATLTAPAWQGKVISRRIGAGSAVFTKCAWEDLPTQYTVVNAFAELEQLEQLGGWMFEMEGGASGAETRRLR